MYAIRSYYGILISSTAVRPLIPLPRLISIRIASNRKALALSTASSPLFTRITSYNVCYTKLLREFSESFYMEARTMTAEARYNKLITNYPEALIQKIPLKHLSSFLGVAPQSLSRIRKKKSKTQLKLT